MGEISDSICGKALVTLSDPDDERLATSLVADARNHAQLRVALVLRHVKTPPPSCSEFESTSSST